jgi:cell division transport system permease protein
MTVALFFVVSTMMIDKLLVVSLDNIQDKVDINVYFAVDAQQPAIDELKTSLEALPDVEEVIFTSRETALEEFMERHKNDDTIKKGLEELGDNPLGASLSIRAKETSQYEGISNYLTEIQTRENGTKPFIEEINYTKNKEAIDKLTNIINAVERSTFIAMLVLVAASILITFNTIRLAIYTTREEIGVMRLVGASNAFIRGPFMLQGIMYGVIAGVLALLIVYPLLMWIGPETETFFQFNIFNYFVQDFLRIFGIIIGAGVLLGIVSSILAVTRYLHV